MPTARDSAPIATRVTDEERVIAERQAEALGLTLSSYVRALIVHARTHPLTKAQAAQFQKANADARS